MANLWDEFSNPTFTPFWIIVARLVFAAGLGAVIGFEREWRNQPAGFRTHILVCMAAAIFALLVIEITQSPVFKGDDVRFDPIRMIEAVTAGVAFLAAGLIILRGGEVKGVTTGAGLWFAGAIGVSCGLGFWQVATLATALAMVVLGLLGALKRRIERASPKTSGKGREEALE